MNENFEVGDIVRLKSGGPKMTVVKNIKTVEMKGEGEFTGNVACTWFDEKNERQSGNFPQDSLDLD